MRKSGMAKVMKWLVPALVLLPIAGAVALKSVEKTRPDLFNKLQIVWNDIRGIRIEPGHNKPIDLGRPPATYGTIVRSIMPSQTLDRVNEVSRGRYIVGIEHPVVSVTGACRYSSVPSRALELRETGGYHMSITLLEKAIAARECIPLDKGDRVVIERVYASGLAQVRLPGDDTKLWMVAAFIKKFKK